MRNIIFIIIAVIITITSAVAVEWNDPRIRTDHLSDSDVILLYRNYSGGRTITGQKIKVAGPPGPQGKVGMRYRGEWSAFANYTSCDSVTYQGNLYIMECIQ